MSTRGVAEAHSAGWKVGMAGEPYLTKHPHYASEAHKVAYSEGWEAGHAEWLALQGEHPEGKLSLYGYCEPVAFEEGVINIPLHHLHRWLESEALDLEATDYQRGHVWTEAQQSAYVGHVLEGGDPGLIIVNRPPDPKAHRLPDYDKPPEIVDGKQRLTALLGWMNNDFHVKLHTGRSVYFCNLTPWSQTRGLGRAMLRVGRTIKTRTQILELYLKLNGAGTPHTQAELDRVRSMLAAEKAKEQS